MRVLGLDVGIASIGWALIEIDDIGDEEGAQGEILAAGVWKFDPPEEKTQMAPGSNPRYAGISGASAACCVVVVSA